MEKNPGNEINLKKMIDASRKVETLLNEIINNSELSPAEMQSLAGQSLDAVNEYTAHANRNIEQLKEQTQDMWEKVKFVLDETVRDDDDSIEESDININ